MTHYEAEHASARCLSTRLALLKVWRECGLVPSPMWIETYHRQGWKATPFYINWWLGSGPYGKFQVALQRAGDSWFQNVTYQSGEPKYGTTAYDLGRMPWVSPCELAEGLETTRQFLLCLTGKGPLPDSLVPTKFDEWGVDRATHRP